MLSPSGLERIETLIEEPALARFMEPRGATLERKSSTEVKLASAITNTTSFSGAATAEGKKMLLSCGN
jgi:hypothetical protein